MVKIGENKKHRLGFDRLDFDLGVLLAVAHVALVVLAALIDLDVNLRPLGMSKDGRFHSGAGNDRLANSGRVVATTDEQHSLKDNLRARLGLVQVDVKLLSRLREMLPTSVIKDREHIQPLHDVRRF